MRTKPSKYFGAERGALMKAPVEAFDTFQSFNCCCANGVTDELINSSTGWCRDYRGYILSYCDAELQNSV